MIDMQNDISSLLSIYIQVAQPFILHGRFESINNAEGFIREEIDAKPFLKIGCTEKECFNSEILRIGAPDHGSLVNFV